MTEADIATAMGQQLVTPAIGTVVWENKDAEPAKPYLVFEIIPTETTDQTIAGGSPRHVGYVQVSVVSDTDKFNTPGLGLADAVALRFPYGLRLTAGTGQITITKPPHVQRGYHDGINWRVPVRIDYQANA